MRIVGSFEAKTHFSKLLVEVGLGEKLLITKNGKPVAMLVPVEEPGELTVGEAMDRLRKLRNKLSSKKITLAEIDEMRKVGRK